MCSWIYNFRKLLLFQGSNYLQMDIHHKAISMFLLIHDLGLIH